MDTLSTAVKGYEAGADPYDLTAFRQRLAYERQHRQRQEQGATVQRNGKHGTAPESGAAYAEASNPKPSNLTERAGHGEQGNILGFRRARPIPLSIPFSREASPFSSPDMVGPSPLPQNPRELDSKGTNRLRKVTFAENISGLGPQKSSNEVQSNSALRHVIRRSTWRSMVAGEVEVEPSPQVQYQIRPTWKQSVESQEGSKFQPIPPKKEMKLDDSIVQSTVRDDACVNMDSLPIAEPVNIWNIVNGKIERLKDTQTGREINIIELPVAWPVKIDQLPPLLQKALDVTSAPTACSGGNDPSLNIERCNAEEANVTSPSSVLRPSDSIDSNRDNHSQESCVLEKRKPLSPKSGVQQCAGAGGSRRRQVGSLLKGKPFVKPLLDGKGAMGGEHSNLRRVRSIGWEDLVCFGSSVGARFGN